MKAAKPRPSVVLEENADSILELALRFHISAVRVFGSAVHGTDTTSSDIDLLVTVDDEASVFDLAGFENAVSGLSGYPVDVVSDGAPSSPIMDRIVAESIPL